LRNRLYKGLFVFLVMLMTFKIGVTHVKK